ncbi:MAG TPA: BPSS1780 family membrane protein, partial [Methylophilaceae bacterium]|nr:BPSS1780 family membrane protein [Methylophilaceae bacterium]
MQTYQSSFKQGFIWIRESFALFKPSPAKWLLLALAYVILYVVLPSLQLLPLVLKVLIGLSWPLFLVVAIAMFREADLQRDTELGDILRALKPHVNKLLALGGICLLYGMVVSYFTQDDMQALATLTDIKAVPEAEASMARNLGFVVKFVLLLTPMLMATWFSPMLIAFNDYPLGKAVKSSIAGCLKFMLALGAAWLILTVFMTLGMMLIGMVIGLIAAISQPLGLSLIAVLLLSSL